MSDIEVDSKNPRNIYADEKNVFVMRTMVQETRNGGKTFILMSTRDVHVDHHVLWIDTENPQNRLLGNDGGVYQSKDAGQKWSFYNNLYIGQYYAITIDQENPYRVFGGKQDNGVWGGPSGLTQGGIVPGSLISNISWGDGFWAALDPVDSTIAFGESQYGGIIRYEFRTDKSFSVQPRNHDKKNPYRFNWNTPYFISTHPPHALYLGGNKLLKSENRGEDWTEISPDLSRNEYLKKRTIMGMKPVLKPYASVTAQAESPLKPGIIYAGTDDGNLQMTRDGGQTWESLTSTMPAEAVIRGFAEHPLNPDLLYCGIHNGLPINSDSGKTWIRAPGLIPVAIDDIKVQMPSGDVVLGSYGRGIILRR